MSDSTEILRRKINSAGELGSVVRTMKALATPSITQYEQAVRSLSDCYHAIELGLCVCFRDTAFSRTLRSNKPRESFTKGIVFGSDQGLVGQFNDQLANLFLAELDRSAADKNVWTVGERIRGKLQDAGLPVGQSYSVPNSVTAITPLVSQILIDHQTGDQSGETYVFHNRPVGRQNYEPVKQRLLPLDATWQSAFSQAKWPTRLLPEVLGSAEPIILALIREYLFVSLFKACAESLASEKCLSPSRHAESSAEHR
jgi:F-type H+-transporting ATPase subunit gamma